MAAAIVAAGAHDFGLVADAFAVRAAVLLLLWWNAATGWIRAFFWGCGHVLLLGAQVARVQGCSMRSFRKGMAAPSHFRPATGAPR